MRRRTIIAAGLSMPLYWMRLSRFPAQGATVHHGYGITDSFWHLDVILGKPDVGSISRLNGYLQADPNPHESASCRNRQEIVLPSNAPANAFLSA